MTHLSSTTWRGRAVIAVGVIVLAHSMLLAVLAWRLGSGAPDADDIRGIVVVAGLVAGGALIGGLALGSRQTISRRALAVAVGVGLLARLFPVAAAPLLETDFRRFLWDGAVVMSGHSPYDWSPADVRAGHASVPEALVSLAGSAPDVLGGVNHPELRSVYPVGAQGAFAAAHVLVPFSSGALRLVFLVFDVATLVLLLRILRGAGLSAVMALWYWWNPLVIQQTYSAAHFDVMIGPLVLAALLAAAHRRPFAAGSLLAAAAAAKAWPVILLPLVLRPFWPEWRRLAAVFGAFGTLSALLWWPVATSVLDSGSGFVAYGVGWESNDGAFRLLLVTLYRLVAESPALVDAAPAIVRGVVGLVLVAFVVRRSLAAVTDTLDLLGRAGSCIAVLFLLSPTQFPWYYAWLAPFLALAPRASLLLLTATLALYPLQWDEPRVLWLEHGPVWLLLATEFAFPRRMQRVISAPRCRKEAAPCSRASASVS